MSMTESVARARYCFQRGTTPLRDTPHCMASACMAWRWMPAPVRQRIFCEDKGAQFEPSIVPERARREGWIFIPADDDNFAQWLEPEAAYQARRKGYCGLAGTPVTP